MDWASIFVDSQASLRALESNKPVSGHQLADEVHEAYERVMKKHPRAQITFRWVAAHKMCAGNEEADRLAKLASDGEHNSPPEELPTMLRRPLPWNKSAKDMGMMRNLKARAAVVLRTSKQWAGLVKIDPSMPSTRFRKMQVEMTKGQAALYIQLRTGHAPLNKHLHKLKAKDSPVCTGCNMAHETVKHYLLDCPATSRIRAKMMYELGTETRSITMLLSNKKALKPLLKFIGRSGRFGEAFGTMELPESEE